MLSKRTVAVKLLSKPPNLVICGYLQKQRGLTPPVPKNGKNRRCRIKKGKHLKSPRYISTWTHVFQAFAELQVKAIETSKNLRVSDVLIENLKRRKQHASITEREISALDTNTKTYESVGRMFILTPINQVKEDLKKRQEQADASIKDLENNKAYLEKSLKDAENNLREMVQQRKDA